MEEFWKATEDFDTDRPKAEARYQVLNAALGEIRPDDWAAVTGTHLWNLLAKS